MEKDPGLVIRIASTADVEQIVGLVQCAYRGEESRRGWTTEADLVVGNRTTSREVTELVLRPASVMLLALDEGHLVGCCHVEERPGACYLGMFAVRPALQGHGIGRRLLLEAEQLAKRRFGANQMQMQVIALRRELIAWYERLGYRSVGERIPFVNRGSDDVAQVPDLEFELLSKSLH